MSDTLCHRVSLTVIIESRKGKSVKTPEEECMRVTIRRNQFVDQERLKKLMKFP